MLTHDSICGFNPFDWDDFACPICTGKKFTSTDYAAVYCDGCGARFATRQTAGDPGVVVDCFATRDDGAFIYAPLWECAACGDGQKHARFPFEDKLCPVNCSHGQMTSVQGLSGPWLVPDHLKRTYLILKFGDYCSGWIDRNYVHLCYPTQAQWDQFQEQRERQADNANATPQTV